MNRVIARTCTTAGLALLFPLAMAPASSWGDPNGEVLPLTCGGVSYTVVVSGNGEFTPARDTASNKVFIPHAFPSFHGEIRDAAGTLVDSFDDPPVVQGSGKQKNDLSCTYSFHFVGDGSDDFPVGWTFDGVGTVTGQVAGH